MNHLHRSEPREDLAAPLAATSQAPPAPIRILHLEDDPTTSQLVSERLRQDGLQVEIERVDTLPDFTQRLATRPHDLILSDFTIPGMHTFDALDLAHSTRPDLPYVFFSGTLGEEAAVEALKHGATDFVVKDRPGRLPSAVRRALREAEQARQAHPPSQRPLAAAAPHSQAAPAPPATHPPPWFGYAAALAGTALAAFLRWGFGTLVGQALPPFITFYPAVLLAALLGGLGPGLLAAALSALVADFYFLSPIGAFGPMRPADQVAMVLFCAVSIMVSLVADALRAARARATAEARRATLSEQRFRLFMDNAPTLAWVKDEQGRYVFLNKAYEQHFGVRLADCQGKTDSELWDPDTAARLREADQHALAAGHPIEVTEQTTEANGATSFWHNTKFTFHDQSGHRHLASLGLDITLRKRAEDALRASEERLRHAISTPTVGVLFFNLDGRIHEANAAFQRMSGYTAEELRTFHWKVLTAPESWDVTAHAAQELANQGETAPYEKQMVRKDGSRWWGLFAPMRLSGSECMEFIVDITEQRRTEAALQRRNQHLQLLHQASARLLVGQQPVELLRQLYSQIAQVFGADAFMLYQAGPDNGPLHLQACAGFTAAEQHKLQTLRYGRAICAHPAEALQPIIATQIQTTQAPNRRFVRKLGFRSYLYYPLILNHRLHGTVAFASRTRDDYGPTDLDFFHTIAGTLAEALERERLETQLQRHAANLERTVQERTAKLRETIAELEGFSYSLVHDMRAPLRAMLAFAGILEAEAGPHLGAEHLDMLRKISLSAKRMDQLVVDSLNYSKILRQDLPLSPLNLGVFLRGMVETYPDFQEPQADVAIDVGDLTVLGNEAALTQVFSNLLGNAVKFVAPGVHPCVRVWAEPAEPSTLNSAPEMRAAPPSVPSPLSTGFLRVFVEDNGIGIPEDQHEKIFGMFQRLHRADEYPGTGIGLALVQKSLERTGGRIRLESESGRGTRFCVELPLATPAEPAPAPTHS